MKTKPSENKGKSRKVVKIISIILALIILLPIIALFIGRGVNDIRLRLPGGVREKGYIELGGALQYISIRGADASNPVIIYLHGGGSPGYILPLQQIVEADYTFVFWEQRGEGRSYIKSPDAELSLEILLNDLDELVDYAAERFNQPIIIVGHSGGTTLGIQYAEAHPDKLAGFIGIGQMVDSSEAGRFFVKETARSARESGNEQDALEIEEIDGFLEEFWKNHPDLDYYTVDDVTRAKIDKIISLLDQYDPFPSPPTRDDTVSALLSPDFDWARFRWELALRNLDPWIDIEKVFDAQQPVAEVFGNLTPPGNLDIPVVFINGSIDGFTPAVLVQEYFERLTAPKKEIFILQGVGHLPMEEKENIEIFSETLKKALAIVLE
jgi:pimeloyl-ACP methyl ester carboxylesterase